MKNKKIQMGTIPEPYGYGDAQFITFCVTEECNLRCKYCYMVHKNSFNVMSFETAKKAVDFFLSQPIDMNYVVWDFIGGEPTLEIELIDQIADYILYRMYVLNHPWFNRYMFSFGTNGILYNSPGVQKFISKNTGHVSISITIDGTKEKHDMQRVYKDGTGSYDDIIQNIPRWLDQFPGITTKVTFSSDDLVFLKDSIIHLWNIGIKRIPANVVYEDVWKPGDDEVLEDQLKKLADYIIDNKMWEEYSVRFFDPTIGFPAGKDYKSYNFCGVGTMVAVDSKGKLYPCVRFLDFCLPEKDTICVGDINEGYNLNKDIFKYLNMGLVNDGECKDCPIATGCITCTGCSYSYSMEDSVFNRVKFHCNMHKATIRANEYFWDRLADEIYEVTPLEVNRKEAYMSDDLKSEGAKYLYFILNDTIYPHCSYESGTDSNIKMPVNILTQGLEYAHRNNFIPIFLGNTDGILTNKELRKFHIQICSEVEMNSNTSDVELQIPIYSTINYKNASRTGYKCILLLEKKNIKELAIALSYLSDRFTKIDLSRIDLSSWSDDDIKKYEQELIKITSYFSHKHSSLDRLNIFNHDWCQAGVSNFALAPNGLFYPCPAFYFYNKDKSIGNIKSGMTLEQNSIYTMNKSQKCKECSNETCNFCTYINKTTTGAVNIPHDNYCKLIKAELSVSKGEVFRHERTRNCL